MLQRVHGLVETYAIAVKQQQPTSIHRSADPARAASARRTAEGPVRDDRRPGRVAQPVATRGANEQTRVRVAARGRRLRSGSALDIAMVRVKENHAVKEADADTDGAAQREPV